MNKFMTLPDIDIQQYNYILPEDNIAQYPAKIRGTSNLLLAHHQPFSIVPFAQLCNHVPENALLIFNETKVIPARLVFAKSTGARIEIFLLQPEGKKDYQLSLSSTSFCEWNVLIGNASKWKEGSLQISFDTKQGSGTLSAVRTAAETVRFEWTPETLTFSEILEYLAQVPLPPYIHRQPDQNDRDRYQTVFARNEGSVAAPTAGLHFTQSQLEHLTKKNIQPVALTLHVGLGTFRPVKKDIATHQMHSEPFTISYNQLSLLAQQADRPWIVVGTTTLRALESVYLFACKIQAGKSPASNNFHIDQWDKWQDENKLSRNSAFNTLLSVPGLEKNNLHGSTSLCIVDGKPVRSADYLITNFHQPGSTLLMLVDAFASVNWQEAYGFAMENNMRFLSYGDACLFKNKAL